jgi:hypothetical protein
LRPEDDDKIDAHFLHQSFGVGNWLIADRPGEVFGLAMIQSAPR